MGLIIEMHIVGIFFVLMITQKGKNIVKGTTKWVDIP